MSVARLKFSDVALVTMPLEVAEAFLGSLPKQTRPAVVLEGVHNDLEAVRSVAPALAESALAGTAIAMALEIENPYVSATAKSMCANALREAMAKLRELVPPAEEGDALDELRARREARLAGQSAT